MCGTEDKSELAEMRIVNARRRQRAAMSAKAEQECRADNPNIFNNVVNQIPNYGLFMNAEPNLTNKNENLINIHTQYVFA